MFKEFPQAADFIKQHGIEMIDLKFTGLFGRWHHVTISDSEFTPQLMQAGVGFDASSVGLASVKSGDKVLIPDLSTGYYVDPFYDLPTLSFICRIMEADSGKLFQRDPRQIARRAEELLVESGYADYSLWGPELEFNVLRQVSFENSAQTVAYHIDALEAGWNRCSDGHGYFISERSGYHAIPPTDQLHNLRSKMVATLKQMGIPVKYHHHEVGALGQCEIETPMLGLLQAADASMTIKYVSRNVACREGQTVTFLPKPIFGEAGNGMHFHQHLFKGGINLFYDAQAPHLLSQTALQYIGGLLTHAPALLAITNPSTNSYRRLVLGFEAPVKCIFSSGNRSAAIRIPRYANQPDTVRMEFRPPDATCNPYLAMAAMLLAGMDGIRQQIDPTQAGFGPVNEDIFEWDAARQAQLKSLPQSLLEAVQALQDDHAFLTESGVFDEELINDWCAAKRAEHHLVQVRPHPYEIQMYYDL